MLIRATAWHSISYVFLFDIQHEIRKLVIGQHTKKKKSTRAAIDYVRTQCKTLSLCVHRKCRILIMILDTNKLENKLVFDAVQIEKSSNDRR